MRIGIVGEYNDLIQPAPKVCVVTGETFSTGGVTRRVPANPKVFYRMSQRGYRRATSQGLLDKLDEAALGEFRRVTEKDAPKPTKKRAKDDQSASNDEVEG